MTETLSAQHALAIVEHCPFALLVMDFDGRITSYNRAFEDLVGRAQAEVLLNRRIAEIGDHPARNLLDADKVVHNGRFREGTPEPAAAPTWSPCGPAKAAVCWTDRNNRQRYFEIRCIDLPGAGLAQARLFVDISRQAELEQAHDNLNRELKQNTLTDPVTGLLNQRGVMLALEPQVARSRRYNSPIAVIMMSVQSSDADNTLRHVAHLLKDQLRWADLIGCTERHEFMLILPETTAEASLHLAEKLQQRLQDMTAEKLDGRSIDTCYGVTGWRRNDNADSLLKRAAEALSRARAEHHNHPIAL